MPNPRKISGIEANRRMKPVIALTPYLENAIFNYESDTFSAKGSQITKTEARQVANRIVRSLVRNGSTYFDGVTISNHLNSVRGL